MLQDFRGFMFLPGELRNEIYVHALAKGSVLMPPLIDRRISKKTTVSPKFWRSSRGVYPAFDRYEGSLLALGRTPCGPLGLIQGVCAAVQDEAMSIFLNRNWLIYASPTATPFGCPAGSISRAFEQPRTDRVVSLYGPSLPLALGMGRPSET